MKLSAEHAQELFSTASFLLISDLHEGSSVGLDGTFFVCTNKFNGFKFIPPGLHLLVVCPVGQFVRQAVWLNFDATRQVKSVAYDTENELVGDVEQSIAISEESLRTLDPHLAPYDLQNVLPSWKGLSNKITSESVQKIIGSHMKIDSLCEEEGDSAMQFTAFSLKKSWPENTVGEERTKYSQDKAWLLQDVINRSGSVDALIGELQLAFLLSTLVHVPYAMLHHETIMKLFSSAIDITHVCNTQPGKTVASESDVYVPFMTALSVQLASLRPDFFRLDLPGQEDVWRTCLRDLKSNRNWDQTDMEKSWNILSSVCKNFGWNMENKTSQLSASDLSDEDDLPLVIET